MADFSSRTLLIMLQTKCVNVCNYFVKECENSSRELEVPEISLYKLCMAWEYLDFHLCHQHL